MHKSRTLFTTLGLLALAAAGCELIDDVLPPGGGGGPGPATPPTPPRACTAIGCHDQLAVTVEPSGGTFPAGTHVITAEVPGQPARTCELVITAATGSNTSP